MSIRIWAESNCLQRKWLYAESKVTIGAPRDAKIDSGGPRAGLEDTVVKFTPPELAQPTPQALEVGGWFTCTRDPCRPGRDAKTAVTGGPESSNLGSGSVNSMVNIMNRPQGRAPGPHVLCDLGHLGYVRSPHRNRRDGNYFLQRRQRQNASAEVRFRMP